MNTERIKELAIEAGDDWEHTLKEDREFLERFAALVAAAERKACAKVCIGLEIPDDVEDLHPDFEKGMLLAAMQCSAAIRARGNE